MLYHSTTDLNLLFSVLSGKDWLYRNLLLASAPLWPHSRENTFIWICSNPHSGTVHVFPYHIVWNKGLMKTSLMKTNWLWYIKSEQHFTIATSEYATTMSLIQLICLLICRLVYSALLLIWRSVLTSYPLPPIKDPECSKAFKPNNSNATCQGGWTVNNSMHATITAVLPHAHKQNCSNFPQCFPQPPTQSMRML